MATARPSIKIIRDALAVDNADTIVRLSKPRAAWQGYWVYEGDTDVNEMCDFTLSNNLIELHIYFEHPIDNPIIPEVMLLESSSSYSYESVEDEAYKPPPPGYKTDDSEGDSPKKSRKAKSKFVSPRKKIHTPRKTVYTGKRKDHHILSGSGSGVGPAGGSFNWNGPGNASDAGPASGSPIGPPIDDDNSGSNMEFPGSFEEEILKDGEL
ncbi:hypothetical protein PIB30_046509 [Stylosanthes scabra]|uniref:Uncharacterized protein n=1 Tax=Stylosanthes scabra TaxID=79078 RepID=A0ABU6XFI6_9FABA|nr:hypothetical protein [Stylosanthes scabra]